MKTAESDYMINAEIRIAALGSLQINTSKNTKI